MSSLTVNRRLAAIFAADVAGYSRLMGADEAGTLEILNERRAQVVTPAIDAHQGRLVKTTGDGFLVEFQSVVAAVQCAIEIQRAMAERNATAPENKKLAFRIGINLGDVIIQGDDIFGDGVNIAARLEQIAEPGGICVSARVKEEIDGKVAISLWDIGDQELRNISRPIRVYRTDGVAPPTVGLPLPNKPSLAILPFSNMSSDPDQEHFADGITEDLTTNLSRIRWLFVIARNSSFTYKGKPVNVRQVARELGVRYVLEGSVRRAGNRVRITAQLIEAASGAHLWAERYDRELTDIFSIQDEISQRVGAAIEPNLIDAEYLRVQNRSSQDLDAWEMVARATVLFRRMTKSSSKQALALLEDATRRFPDYAPGQSVFAFATFLSTHMGLLELDPSERNATIIKARAAAQRAAELDDRDAWTHMALAYSAMHGGQTHFAIAEYEKALQLNPNFAEAYGYLGITLATSGLDPERAILESEKAIRLSPHDPNMAFFLGGIGIAYYMQGRFEDAVEWIVRSNRTSPELSGSYRWLCAALGQAGRIEEAKKVLERMYERWPDISLSKIAQFTLARGAALQKQLEGLRMAGMRE